MRSIAVENVSDMKGLGRWENHPPSSPGPPPKNGGWGGGPPGGPGGPPLLEKKKKKNFPGQVAWKMLGIRRQMWGCARGLSVPVGLPVLDDFSDTSTARMQLSASALIRERHASAGLVDTPRPPDRDTGGDHDGARVRAPK